MERVRIVIVDDHKIIRDGLIAILKDDPSISVVGGVESGDKLLELMKYIAVDLIILDMHMPFKNGAQVAREVKAQFPQVKILMNTMSELPDEIEDALSAGVNGYLLKTFGTEELVKAIQMVAYGNSYFAMPVIKAYIKNLNKPLPTDKRLTPTELKIVKMLSEEKQHSEIMDELQMSKGMLNNDLQNMYDKLKLKTEIGLVKFAMQEKLIE
jgi:DNA-binding NarL/FixJ family response regulator